MTLVEIPGANHMFLAASPADSRRNLEAITHAVTTWLETIPGITKRPETGTR